MSDEPLIALADAEKRYGRKTVLAIDRLDICKGDLLGVYGDNGSGKSTLLKVLARVVPLSRGRLTWASSIRGKRVVFVPQSGGLYANLTVAENLGLYHLLYGTDAAAGLETVAALGLEGFLHDPVENLSGGFQKLAAIACALAVAPVGIFLDEPFSGLDEEHVDLVVSRFRALDGVVEFLIASDHSQTDRQVFQRTIRLSVAESA